MAGATTDFEDIVIFFQAGGAQKVLFDGARCLGLLCEAIGLEIGVVEGVEVVGASIHGNLILVVNVGVRWRAGSIATGCTHTRSTVQYP